MQNKSERVIIELEAIREEWFESEEGLRQIEEVSSRNEDKLRRYGLLDGGVILEDSQQRGKKS